MRVAVLVKANADSEAGKMPSDELFRAMAAFNEELVNAGVMTMGEGLTPSVRGKRVRFDSKRRSTVVDGPFAETKELVAGLWIWQVASMDEALEWIKRAPFEDSEVELRPIFGPEDFAGLIPDDVIEKESRLRALSAEKAAKKS
jgi:hypothetical protein